MIMKKYFKNFIGALASGKHRRFIKTCLFIRLMNNPTSTEYTKCFKFIYNMYIGKYRMQV